jgi:hypothetical protein
MTHRPGKAGISVETGTGTKGTNMDRKGTGSGTNAIQINARLLLCLTVPDETIGRLKLVHLMKICLSARLLPAALFVILAVTTGCGDSTVPSDVSTDTSDALADAIDLDVATGDADVADRDADAVSIDANDTIDSAVNDADSTVDAPPELLVVPYVTPECTNPYVDRPYLQETNHSGIEVDQRILDVRDIVLRPANAPEWFDAVTLVGPNGFYRRGELGDMTGELETYTAEPERGVVLGAAFGPTGLYVIQELGISLHDGETMQFYIIPEGDEVFSKLSRAWGWTLLTSGTRVFAFTGTLLLNITPPETAIEIQGATINSDHTRLYLSGLTTESIPTIEVWAIDENGALGGLLNSFDVPVSGVRDLIADVTLPEALELVMVGPDGIAGIKDIATPVTAEIDLFLPERVPLTGATDAAATSDGGFIVTTNGGAYRMISADIGPEWRFYNTLRWVVSDDVRKVATTPEAPDSPIYFASAAGMTWVTVETMNLEQKITGFIDRVVTRHDRDGAVADSKQTIPGDLSTNIPWDSDNDGGWTCYWVIAECLRYKQTNDPAAKAHFDKSLQAMLNLRLLTGTDWFLARSVIRIDGCQLDDCDNPDDGLWFKSPDGEWWVKSDTSNDEVTSHMFMMGFAYDLCADDTQKEAIKEHVSHIVGGIVDNGFQLVKPDGECTTYGQFDPFYINSIGMFGDGGRRSAQMLGALNLAIYLTGDAKFIEAKRFLIEENNYAENVVHESEPPGRKGHPDGDELAMQAFVPLLRYETDPALYAMWIDGWHRTYTNIRLQQGALWDVFNGMLGGESPEYVTGSRWLRRVPMNLIRWPIHNDHRTDLINAPEYYYGRTDTLRMRSDGRILPPDERPIIRHNANQFEIEGGWGSNTEMDGADIVAAYWIARYYGFIVPEAK